MSGLTLFGVLVRATGFGDSSLFGDPVAYHVSLTLLPLAVLGAVAFAIHRSFPRAPR